MAPDDDDKKVKDLIDAATRAELERWFGLPSFQEVAEQKRAAPQEDPDIAAVRQRRQKAIEAVDPAMVEAHRRRTDVPEDLLGFKANLEVRVDPSVALFDLSMIDKPQAVAEPREVEIPEELRDDLKDCTPQAILRDLHRPELYFDKLFEVVDIAAEQKVDVVDIVAGLMRTRFKHEPDPTSIFQQGAEILRELRVDRMRSWAHALPHFPNRRVTE